MTASKCAKVVALVLLMGFSRSARAANVTLAWDPPTDGLTTGYVLYYGIAPHTYSQQVDVGYTTSQYLTNLPDGATYYFAVRAYDAAGVMSDLSQEVSATVTPTAPPVVTSLSLNSSVPSPQLTGTTVNWLSTATGGVAPYQFQWAFYQAGSWTSWPWSAASSWTWTPGSAASDYQVRVSVRSSGSTNTTGELTQTVPFVISGPVASATLNSNVPSPQAAGTAILWSASALGGIAPYQYRWWVFDGSVWSAATSWTTSSTWSWTPRSANSAYTVRVWVRSASDTVDAAEASTSVVFPITAALKGKGGGCQGPKCK
jgi:hypothetical protein